MNEFTERVHDRALDLCIDYARDFTRLRGENARLRAEIARLRTSVPRSDMQKAEALIVEFWEAGGLHKSGRTSLGHLIAAALHKERAEAISSVHAQATEGSRGEA